MSPIQITCSDIRKLADSLPDVEIDWEFDGLVPIDHSAVSEMVQLLHSSRSRHLEFTDLDWTPDLAISGPSATLDTLSSFTLNLPLKTDLLPQPILGYWLSAMPNLIKLHISGLTNLDELSAYEGTETISLSSLRYLELDYIHLRQILLFLQTPALHRLAVSELDLDLSILTEVVTSPRYPALESIEVSITDDADDSDMEFLDLYSEFADKLANSGIDVSQFCGSDASSLKSSV